MHMDHVPTYIIYNMPTIYTIQNKAYEYTIYDDNHINKYFILRIHFFTFIDFLNNWEY